jgi:ABC-type transport system substrate-binding protein
MSWRHRFPYFVVGALLLLVSCTGKTTTPPSPTTAGTAPGQPARGGTMHMAAPTDLVTLDNSQAVSTIDYSMTAGAIYEGLYHIDSQGNIVPALADGMPDVSSDGLTYTIHLREGAMFAGPNFTPRQVTADDAAFGMIRALDPNTKPAPSWGGGYLYPIEGAPDFAAGKASSVSGIRVVDPKTLQITLSAPASTFIYDLTIATSWPVPKEAVQQRGEKFGDEPVGAGPFYVASWQKGQSITIKRNTGYVDPNLPYLDAITLDLNVDTNTDVLRLENGSIDAVFEPYTLPQAALAQLQQAPNVVMTPTTGPTIYYWALNNEGILKNDDLRKAVAMSVTRDFVKQFGSEVQPWNQIFASVTHQSDPNVKDIPYDPQKAKALLQQAGYNGEPIKVIYDATDPFATAMSTSLQQDLKALGMNVQLKGLQEAAYFGDAGYNNPQNYDMLPTYWREDYPDGQDFISTNFVCAQVNPPGLNVARWCDPQVDKLLSKSDALQFGPQRDQILRQIQQIIIDQAAGIPMFQVNFPIVYTDKVGGMVSLPTYAPVDWKLSWLRG